MERINKIMEEIKSLTIVEYAKFMNELRLYNAEVGKMMGLTEEKTSSSSNKSQEKKKDKHSNEKQILTIDKEVAFSSGLKCGAIVDSDDCVLTCATTDNNTVIGGQCIINSVVCNYSFYMQWGKPFIYSNDITEDQIKWFSKEIYKHIPKKGVRIFDPIPNDHPTSPSYPGRFYYKELQQGSFIYQNPNGSYVGYTNGIAFIMRNDSYIDATPMAYVFGGKWRKPKDEVKKLIKELKIRAFGDDPKKFSSSKNAPIKTNADKFVNKSKDKSNKTLPASNLSSAASMQNLDLSALD